MDLAWEVAELRRRLASVVRICAVAEVDYGAALVRVRWQTDPPALSGWLPFAAQRAGGDSTWNPPDVGEHVIVLSPNGEMAAAICALSVYSAAHGPPGVREEPRTLVRYRDRARELHDSDSGRHMYVAGDGARFHYIGLRRGDMHECEIELPAGATLSVTADGGIALLGDVTLDGDLAVTGDVSATGDVSSDGDVSDAASSMQAMRDAHNAHLHPAGSPPGNTGPTTRRMA